MSYDPPTLDATTPIAIIAAGLVTGVIILVVPSLGHLVLVLVGFSVGQVSLSWGPLSRWAGCRGVLHVGVGLVSLD